VTINIINENPYLDWQRVTPLELLKVLGKGRMVLYFSSEKYLVVSCPLSVPIEMDEEKGIKKINIMG